MSSQEQTVDTEGLEIRLATPQDHGWMVDLIDATRHAGLTEAERAQKGFVQGEWTPQRIEALSVTGVGASVASVGGRGAGLALSSGAGAAAGGPAGETNRVAAEQLAGRRYYLYGPVVVGEEFQGRGLLRRLMEHQFSLAAADFEVAVAFVELANQRSRSVHAHLGWTDLGEFALGERRYVVITHGLSGAA